MRASLERRLRLLSPRHRKWQQLLNTCTFDPDSRRVDPIGEKDFIICGHSRSGTALVTAALWNPPSVVTVMEPWDCFRLPPRELFDSLRSEMRSTRRLSRGRLDVGAVESDRAVRWQRDGERSFPVKLERDALLGVKMPAFWRLLPHLRATRFVVCLRDPVEVVRSYGTVGGRLARGLDYDIPFNQRMNRHLAHATDDLLRRRVEMFDYVAERLLPYLDDDNVLVLRYERWSIDPQGQLDALADFLGVDRWPLAVDITPPRPAEFDSTVVRAVVDHCWTAEQLGYHPAKWLSHGSAAVGSDGEAST